MSTDLLLFLGPATVAIFVLVVTVEGARRPGYDAGYHTGSELELGDPLIFLALLAALVAVAAQLDGLWRFYTVATVVVGAVLVAVTINAYRTDSARTGLVQRTLIYVCLLWVVVLGTALPAGAI
ncbi:MAG: hypothetical protein ACRDUA_08575 [Micromonosporaceae bacterium]